MQKTFDVSGPIKVEIELAAGDIEIDPTLDGQAEVELTAHDEESQRLVDAARVELANGRLLVDVPQKRSGFSFAIVFGHGGISCRVRCPAGSDVTTRTKSADVRVRGTIGSLSAATASGDTRADHVRGDAHLKSANGDFEVSQADGNVSAQTASGDVDLGAVRGKVSANTASGDVRIGEAYADVNVNTVSGDQQHGAVMRGRVTAQAVSGDIVIGVRRGSKAYLDCSTVSGDTASELDSIGAAPADEGLLVEIRAKTVSGDIRITRAHAPATEEVQA
jgi:DUF4097 and DUF4098 domain-containing protein YvlB